MFLLRSRLRAITTSSKQALMAENNIQTSSSSSSSSSSSEQNQSPPLSSFLNSPLFFGGFLSRNISDEISSTPTSILETKQFTNCSNHHPFGFDKKKVFKSSSSSPDNNNNKHHYQKQGIGIALIHDKDKEEEEEDSDSNFSKPNKKMVLFAAKLKVEVPPPFLNSDLSSKSPGDFGIKTKNPQILLPRSFSLKSPCNKARLDHDHDHDHEGLSVREMEMLEEYTCVITHGPNPKITHILDDTVVESCCGDGNRASDPKNITVFLQNNVDLNTSMPVFFLGFCYSCKIKLEDEKDIYMFRGEKAFCSEECRFQEIHKEEKHEIIDLDSLEDSYHFFMS